MRGFVPRLLHVPQRCKQTGSQSDRAHARKSALDPKEPTGRSLRRGAIRWCPHCPLESRRWE